MPSEVFTFYNDPGHGWLAVSPARSLAAGIHPDQYSAFSYYLPRCPAAPGGLLLLEEDCDAGLFFRAAGYDPEINRPNVRDVYGDPAVVHGRRLRSLPHLSGRAWVSPFWPGAQAEGGQA